MSEQIETAEALDALPTGSVVGVHHDGVRDVWLATDVRGYGRFWCGIEVDPEDGGATFESAQRWLYNELGNGSVTVLFRPDAPTPTPAGDNQREALDDDGLTANEQAAALALWERWQDLDDGGFVRIMDDPRSVARHLRPYLATRPPAPTVTTEQVEQAAIDAEVFSDEAHRVLTALGIEVRP